MQTLREVHDWAAVQNTLRPLEVLGLDVPLMSGSIKLYALTFVVTCVAGWVYAASTSQKR